MNKHQAKAAGERVKIVLVGGRKFGSIRCRDSSTPPTFVPVLIDGQALPECESYYLALKALAAAAASPRSAN